MRNLAAAQIQLLSLMTGVTSSTCLSNQWWPEALQCADRRWTFRPEIQSFAPTGNAVGDEKRDRRKATYMGTQLIVLRQDKRWRQKPKFEYLRPWSAAPQCRFLMRGSRLRVAMGYPFDDVCRRNERRSQRRLRRKVKAALRCRTPWDEAAFAWRLVTLR